ncbi:hypothetical protein HOK021_33800 [Streptomyces hygroscopicus]|nr:hypothetical protein HOK021_33800 [Streptomyces hygroscopicus]
MSFRISDGWGMFCAGPESGNMEFLSRHAEGADGSAGASVRYAESAPESARFTGRGTVRPASCAQDVLPKCAA